jgi:acetylornithine deacetylase
LLGPPSLHASFIQGGREWSTYPDRCELRLERRTVPGEGRDEPLAELTRILELLVQEDGALRADAALVFDRPAYEIDERRPFVRRVQEAARSAGGSGGIAGLSFWADTAVLAGAGIESVLFGPGGAGLHSTEEHVRIDDVLTCERALTELARMLCV